MSYFWRKKLISVFFCRAPTYSHIQNQHKHNDYHHHHYHLQASQLRAITINENKKRLARYPRVSHHWHRSSTRVPAHALHKTFWHNHARIFDEMTIWLWNINHLQWSSSIPSDTRTKQSAAELLINTRTDIS